MTWELRRIPSATICPELIYELSRRHRLVPDNVGMALAGFTNLAQGGFVAAIQDDDTIIGTVVVSSIMRGEQADIDLIVQGKYFRQGFQSRLSGAMAPLMQTLFDDLDLRRVNALVPESRSRTVKALESLGFQLEGVKRLGVKLLNSEPEDLFMLGLLSENMED